MMPYPKPIRTPFRNDIATLGARFVADTNAATAMVFAILLPVLVGFGALAFDVGVWLMKSRQAQGAADQAAYSAAIANGLGNNGQTEGRAIAASMGFAHGSDDIVVTVSNPPTSGAFIGGTTYWQVTIQQPQSLGLASLFLGSAPTVTARAVAGAGGGTACIVALSPSADNAVLLSQNAQMTNNACGVYSNSNSATAIRCENNCVLTGSLFTAGNISWGNTQPPGPKFEDQAPVTDPYDSVPSTPPPGEPCKSEITNGGSYQPGRYCSGIKLAASAKNSVVDFAPGVYYIDSKFDIANGFTFNGTGVTLVFNIPTSSNFAIGNNNTFNITAPTSGTHSGIAMMSRTGTYTVEIRNNTIFKVQGALYFPNQPLILRNNLDSTLCTQLVALTVTLENNGTMGNNCPGSGIKGVNGGTVALVE